MVKLFLLDDHPLLLESIKALIEEKEEYSVVGQSSSSTLGIIEQIKGSNCDILILDVSMPNLDAFELTPILKREIPGIKIIIYTMHAINRYYKHFINLNVDGYVVKSGETGSILEAIESVYQGNQYFPQSTLDLIENSDKTSEENQLQFTNFEKELIEELQQFKTNGQIAEKLNCTLQKVLATRENLLIKTGTNNTHELLQALYIK